MEMKNLSELIQVVKKLRDPVNGCPWDLKQTHQSLLKYLIEESYEFVQASEEQDFQKMEEEIGDVLLQVLLHAQIASEKGHFDLENVAGVLRDKLVRRHPHVFGERPSKISSEEVEKKWQEIKKQEKAENTNQEAFSINEKHLAAPALASAAKIGEKTAQLNFDWEDASQVVYKVEEEWQELKEEMTPGVELNKERIKEELGDFLFSTAQLARHAGIDPEEALRAANQKFVRRFNRVETLMKQDGHQFSDLKQKDLDAYWGIAKQEEKNTQKYEK